MYNIRVLCNSRYHYPGSYYAIASDEQQIPVNATVHRHPETLSYDCKSTTRAEHLCRLLHVCVCYRGVARRQPPASLWALNCRLRLVGKYPRILDGKIRPVSSHLPSPSAALRHHKSGKGTKEKSKRRGLMEWTILLTAPDFSRFAIAASLTLVRGAERDRV